MKVNFKKAMAVMAATSVCALPMMNSLSASAATERTLKTAISSKSSSQLTSKIETTTTTTTSVGLVKGGVKTTTTGAIATAASSRKLTEEDAYLLEAEAAIANALEKVACQHGLAGNTNELPKVLSEIRDNILNMGIRDLVDRDIMNNEKVSEMLGNIPGKDGGIGNLPSKDGIGGSGTPNMNGSGSGLPDRNGNGNGRPDISGSNSSLPDRNGSNSGGIIPGKNDKCSNETGDSSGRTWTCSSNSRYIQCKSSDGYTYLYDKKTSTSVVTDTDGNRLVTKSNGQTYLYPGHKSSGTSGGGNGGGGNGGGGNGGGGNDGDGDGGGGNDGGGDDGDDGGNDGGGDDGDDGNDGDDKTSMNGSGGNGASYGDDSVVNPNNDNDCSGWIGGGEIVINNDSIINPGSDGGDRHEASGPIIITINPATDPDYNDDIHCAGGNDRVLTKEELCT